MHPPLPAIERSKDGMIGTVWLNRPDAGNAYDMPMLRQLRRAINAMECDPDVRVIVIRGRGVNFCTGGHMSMLSSGQSWQELSLYAAKTFERVAESRKVTIAAVHGAAIGGGFELMLACDLAIATLEARCKSLAMEVGRNGITCNCVSPSATETPLLEQFRERHPDQVEKLRKRIPIGRFGRPADVAAVVAFLCSNAAEFITGQVISVNGGLHMP